MSFLYCLFQQAYGLLILFVCLFVFEQGILGSSVTILSLLLATPLETSTRIKTIPFCFFSHYILFVAD